MELQETMNKEVRKAKKPRILLVRPPAEYSMRSFPAGPRLGLPLGIMYIASVLKNKGYTVEISDFLVDFDVNALETRLPNEHEMIHFGETWENIKEKIEKKQPGIVGISNQYTEYVKYAIKTAQIVKSIDKDIVTVIGGPHASVQPYTFFEESGDIDIVAIGEGEYTMLEIAQWYEGTKKIDDIKGICFKHDNKITMNERREYIEDLDALLSPAYDMIDMEKYFDLERRGFLSRIKYSYPGSERAISMITSRGCPFDCIFCSIHLHMGKKWRYQSSRYVLSHLEYVIDKYNIRHIHFEDDNLTLNSRRFEEILDGMIEKGFDITWDTPNGVRADHRLNKRILEKCKKSGCTYLILAVESGVQRVHDEITNKRINLTDVEEVIKTCHGLGLDLQAFYMIGFPGETKKEVQKTLTFALEHMKKYNVLPHVNITRPLLGTRLYEICKEKRYLMNPTVLEDYHLHGDIYEREFIETPQFDLEYLIDSNNVFVRKIMMIFFVNTVGFLLKHPAILYAISKDFMSRFIQKPNKLSEILKKLALTKLVYKNCLIR